MSRRLPRRRGKLRRFVVVGGGVSGLAAARVLAGDSPLGDGAGRPAGSTAVSGGGGAGHPSPGAHLPAGEAEVILLERSPRLGGKILTGTIGGVRVELGPDQFLRRDPGGERLARLVHLGDELVAPAARAAAVYSRGGLHPLPAGLMLGVPTDAAALEVSGILSADGLAAFRKLSGLTRLSGSPAPPAQAGPGAGGGGAELPAGAILRALVGDEVVDRLIDPLLGGINAGSVDELSLATIAPQVARLLAGPSGGLAALSAAVAASSPTSPGEEPQSPFLGLSGGLGQLVEATRSRLTDELGATVLTSCGVAGIEQSRSNNGYVVHLEDGTSIESDGVVLALPGPVAGDLLAGLSPEASSPLRGIPYASVALATLVFEPGVLRSARLPAAWSGVLVPRVEGAVMTAVSFLSAKWPWMSELSDTEREVVRVSAGRYRDERIAGEDDVALTRRLLKELSELVGISAEPSASHLQRWEHSFPQYLPGHASAVVEVRRALSGHRALSLAGTALGGIGIPACISSGERAAEEVLAGIQG